MSPTISLKVPIFPLIAWKCRTLALPSQFTVPPALLLKMKRNAEPTEQRGAEEATHKQYDLEAEHKPHSPSPASRRFSNDSGSRAWGQASHRRLTDSEYEAADRQDDDWVGLG